MSEIARKKTVRWWPAILIAVAAAVALPAIWTADISRQDRVLRTALVVIIGGFFLFLWAIFLSRLRGKVRLGIFLGGVAAIVGLAMSVQISGVTGDMVPIFRFRWNKPKFDVAAGPSLSVTNKAGAMSSFPQFLGPDRNGIIRGARLETNWTAQPPQELWRRAVGGAWTGFAVAEGLAITQEQRDGDELVVGYDLLTGQLVWSHTDSARYFTALGGEGPRANPTVQGDRVYTLGGTGILNCLDLKTGQLIWSKDLVAEHAAKVPEWGFAGAPLIHHGAVIVVAGGRDNRSLVAHDAASGKFRWGGGEDDAGYSSPALFTISGAVQIVAFNRKQVQGHDAGNGAVLWTYRWNPSHPHITMPIQIAPDQLLVSSGYGYGSEAIQIASTNGAWTAERVWKSNRFKSKFANLILFNGHVYGLDDGILACLDPKTGERLWHGNRYGHGQLLLIENTLLLMAEKGEVLLIDPSPAEERVVARLRAFQDKTWNPPAFASPYLLVRNNLEAACYKLPLAK